VADSKKHSASHKVVFGANLPGAANSAPPYGIQSVSTTASVVHQSGPIPAADELLKYDQIVSGSAQRIIQMAENQSAHRISIEAMVIKGQLEQSNRGQLLGFILAIAFLLGAVIVTLHGYPWVGTILGGTTITVLGVAFVTGKVYQGENLRAKKPPSKLRPPETSADHR
jgi:uncharacterized membrane protein